MKQWRVYGIASASKLLGMVEAETQEEALTNAEQDQTINSKACINVCHQCGHEIELGDIYEYQVEEA